jgi:dTMP kinase
VYQGHAGGLDPAMIREVGRIATGGTLPDCVFLLDMPPGEADQRLSRPLDRMESQGLEYRKRLQEGFLAEAADWDRRVHVINAARAIEMVQSDVWRIATQVLGIAAP